MTTSTDKVLVETAIAAPIADVWSALRDKDKIAQWFGWEWETLDAEIDLIFFTGIEGEEENRVLRIGTHDGYSDRFELEEKDGKTVVRIVRTSALETDWVNSFDEVVQGWISFVGQLRFYLERSKGRPRRTLWLSGKARQGVLLPRSGLGVPRSVNDFARTAQPEPLVGTVFHSSKFQSGFSVSQWGGGLLVVMDRPAGEDSPFGGGSIIITAYDMSEADFEALRQRWTAWFNERYPPQEAAQPAEPGAELSAS